MIITIPNIFLNDLFFPIIDSGLWTIVATSADGKSTTAAFFLSIFASQDELKEEGFNLFDEFTDVLFTTIKDKIVNSNFAPMYEI